MAILRNKPSVKAPELKLTHDTHDGLAEDLAIAKGGIPYLNACLGSVWNDGKTPRADLVVCTPSYTKFLLSVYEVKITRSDFLSDMRNGKWRDYLPHCHRFYFAVAKGVCTKQEVPEEAGLLIRNENGWYTAKAAPRLQTDVPEETLLSLIFAKQRRSAREKRLDDIESMKKSFYGTDWNGRKKSARVLGNNLSKLYETSKLLNGVEDACTVLEAAHKERMEEMYQNLGVGSRPHES